MWRQFLIASRRDLGTLVRLRSIWWIAAVGIVVTLGVTMALMHLVASSNDPALRGVSRAELVAMAFAKVPVLTLAAGLLGCLVGGAEFRYRLIDRSMLYKPSRTALVLAKVVSASIAALVMDLICVACTLVATTTSGLNFDHGHVSPASWATLVAGQVGTVLAWTAIGVLVSYLSKSQVAAVAVLLLTSSVLEPLFRGLVGGAGTRFVAQIPRYFPFSTINALIQNPANGSTVLFAPEVGMPLAVASLITAGYLLILGRLAIWRLGGRPGVQPLT